MNLYSKLQKDKNIKKRDQALFGIPCLHPSIPLHNVSHCKSAVTNTVISVLLYILRKRQNAISWINSSGYVLHQIWEYQKVWQSQSMPVVLGPTTNRIGLVFSPPSHTNLAQWGAGFGKHEPNHNTTSIPSLLIMMMKTIINNNTNTTNCHRQDLTYVYETHSNTHFTVSLHRDAMKYV